MSQTRKTPTAEGSSPPTQQDPDRRSDLDRWQPFAHAWRHHVERPTTISPQAAAARVVARLAERDRARHRRLSPWRPGLVGALIGATLLALLVVVPARFTAPPELGQSAGEVLASNVAGPNELVLWLDDDTPLHLTLGPSSESDTHAH